ncbi:uncharacterized protein PADG_02689 [Paracoccidioides brasiliensis Pb18]|uniref:Uncharacterized protein n=2 Tax=Paracoccidioides brasiliensis TaxID=121759 RepID=C1G684_PARBD|nr:uncharacterized protein PADG_02689 [Paracoccidioides brasiliensis Pb18]EEH46591.2 hypothetical protein PADG_02689 [Paracoccidioides brasiliensis Pb18]ODH38285.1 hypothetical protein ACO22_02432 [Paracoccidioides brasiliensis]ODH51097.1 hypothetical protein GX48_02709 [Paracoccidioides brasiliensis]
MAGPSSASTQLFPAISFSVSSIATFPRSQSKPVSVSRQPQAVDGSPDYGVAEARANRRLCPRLFTARGKCGIARFTFVT